MKFTNAAGQCYSLVYHVSCPPLNSCRPPALLASCSLFGAVLAIPNFEISKTSVSIDRHREALDNGEIVVRLQRCASPSVFRYNSVQLPSVGLGRFNLNVLTLPETLQDR